MIDIEKKLKELPDVANATLGGISADSSLKYKILSAANTQPAKNKRNFSRLSIALTSVSACLVVLALTFTVFPNLFSVKTPDQPPNDVLIQHSAAGHTDVDTSQTRALLTIPQDSMNITAGGMNVNLSSLWAAGGNNFPLVAVDGKYYRQLTGVDVSGNLGESLGTVEVYTDEPALAPQSGFISNVAPQGSSVYAVSGLSTSGLIAADVNGSVLPFQRISFAGTAILAGESLQSTLGFSSSDVNSLQLSDVGTLTDNAKAQELISFLLNNASYSSPSLGRGSQILHIQLKNGVTIQMYADDDVFSACGAWSCPDFTQAFQNALNQ